MKTDRVLFARIGWMHFYKGVMPGDERLIGGGKWNKTHVGGEVFNFRDVNDWLYGYVQPNGSIAIGRIDPELGEADRADRTLVVFVARHPSGGQRIVGWYSDALVLHESETRSRRARGLGAVGTGASGRWFNLKTKTGNGVLLPMHKRTYDEIPAGAGGMGQSNVCYVREADGAPKGHVWIKKAIEYAKAYDGPNLLTNPLADAEHNVAVEAGEILAGAHGQGFAQNPAQRRAVEKLAMSRAMAHFRKRFDSVTDVSATQSYDIHCSSGKRQLRVEVKGTTGSGDTVFLTRLEVELAKKGGCALFVLHSIKFTKNNARGGVSEVHLPWRLSDAGLTAMTYSYKLG